MKRSITFLFPFFLILLCSFKLETFQWAYDAHYKIISNNNCESYKCQSSSPLLIPNFKFYFGGANADYFTKVITFGGDYYAIGNSTGRASLTRISNAGNVMWTRELSITSAWNDLIITTNNEILLVGINGNYDNNAKSLIGTCTLSGIMNVKSYNYSNRESLTKIYLNPNPENPSFPYYIIGVSNSGGSSLDDILIINANSIGAINWSKNIYNPSQDFEFYRDISIQSNTGDMVIIGNNLGKAALVQINKSGTVINGVEYNENMRFNTIVSNSNPIVGYSHLLGGSNNATTVAQLMKVNGLSTILYNYKVDSLDAITKIIPKPGGGYYALGRGTIRGANRSVVLSLSEVGNSLTLDWSKTLSDNSSLYNFGYIGLMNTTQIAFTEGRQNAINGFGSTDGFISIDNLDFENCLTLKLNLKLSPLNSTNTTFFPSTNNLATPTPSILNANSPTYNQKNVCAFVCNVRFEIQPGNCGIIQFFPSTNQTGTLSYCWDFGDNPPCGSVIQNPIHQYQNNGSYTVCVTIKDGVNSCEDCKIINVSSVDNQAPNLNCPQDITISCKQSILPIVTGNPFVSDNLDPSPVISYTDQIVSSSPCDTSIKRTWLVIDRCNNKKSCTQFIAKKDNIKPNIICPADITIDCQFVPSTLLTGNATASDDCQSQIIISYTDQISYTKPCGSIIKRTFTAEDICGNKSTCVQKITKRDIEKPKIQCPKDITIKCEEDPLPALTGSPSATDNCQSILAFKYSDITNPDDPCNIKITRTWTASDSCGNTSSCNQIIIKKDLLPPAIQNCGRSFTVPGLSVGTDCSAFVNIISPTATDNCNSITLTNNVTNTSNATATYPSGTTIITWTATDMCGNKAICMDTVIILPCGCGDTCATSSLIINTGYDPYSSAVLPINSASSAWTLVASPDAGLSLPLPSTVILPFPSWHSQPSSQWISAYSMSSLNQNNPFPENPYSFQNCFCICRDSSQVTIYLSVLVDNVVDINLYQGSTLICPLLNISSSSTSAFRLPADVTTKTLILNAGTYCIRADLRNLSGVAMGLNIVGSISGAGLLASTCCEETNFLMGQKFIDENCNGIQDPSDLPGEGWTIQLKDNLDHVIATTITDDLGFYNFPNVPIGSYKVCEVQQAGFTNSFPALGYYIVDVTNNYSVINQLNFGNCITDTCCVNSNALEASVNQELIITRDSCRLCISHPGLTSCQQLIIDWGDMQESGPLTVAPNECHSYSQSGDYNICLTFEELDPNGLVCFSKDTCFNVCIECGVCTEKEFSLNWFKGFGHSSYPGNPSEPAIANVSDFYIDADATHYFTTGHYQGIASTNLPDFPGTAVAPNVTDCFVNKYELDGALVWSFSITGDQLDQGLVIKKSPSTNEFFVAGIFNSSSITFPSSIMPYNTTLIRKGNGTNVFLAKYLDLGTTVQLLWSLNMGNDQRMQISDLDIDNSGNPVIIGVFTNEINFDPITNTIGAVNNNRVEDFYLAKYDKAIGNLIWVKTLSSATTSGGAYPLGVSIDPNIDSIYVVGQFSNSVDFDNNALLELTGGPIGATAPFVAKFNTDGLCSWAYPIINPTLFSSCMSCDQGEASDIEAYNDGFIIGLNSIQFGSNYEFNPRGTPTPILNPPGLVKSYVARYNSNGELTCIPKYLDKGNRIKEVSVDPSGFAYLCGGTSVNGSNQEYEFVNAFIAKVDLDCNIKSFSIDGNKNDDAWSIVPSPNSFAVIGRTGSTDFNADPLRDATNNYSANNSSDIFIAKYSCICPADTVSSCCENISIEAIAVSTVDSTCCYTTNFTNNLGFNIIHADVHLLTAGWSFSNLIPSSGINLFAITATSFTIYPLGISIPSGITNDFLKFCLTGSAVAPTTQQIVFSWYEALPNGGKRIVCMDTITTNCAPIRPKGCMQIVESSVICNPEDPNEYCLKFKVKNESTEPAIGISLDILSAGYGMHDCAGTGFNDPYSITFGSVLNPGATSSVQCVKIYANIPVLTPTTICIQNALLLSNRGTCLDTNEFCILLEPCPCGYSCCINNPPHHFDDLPLGNLVNHTQIGWHPFSGLPTIIFGGCNNTSQSLLLYAGTRGLMSSSVEYYFSGVVGPDVIFKKGVTYCMKFCAKLNPVDYTTIGQLLVYTENEPINTSILLTSNNNWIEYTLTFTPTSDAYSLFFKNASAAPLDYGPSIQIDEICFQEPIPIFNDVTPPIFDCPLSESTNVVDSDCSYNYTIPNIPVTDDNGVESIMCNLDGHVVNIGSIYNLTQGVHQILFTAIDYCGNTAQCSYEIIIHCESCPCPNGNSGPNIVVNGDFEDGNVGFNSDYVFIPSPTSIIPGQYGIRNSFQLYNGSWSCQDHTNGDPLGNFLIADGPSPANAVWYQTYSLTDGEAFSFCFFANNLVRPNLNSVDPVILVRVNGLTVFGPQAIPEFPDTWIPITFQFVAGSNPSTISIFNVAVSGYADLAIDDISLSSCAIVKDTCECKSISNIVFGNPEFNRQASCNQTKPIEIPCPINELSFNVTGQLNCSDNCKNIVKYIIRDASGGTVQQGSATPSSPNFFGINGLVFTLFNPGALYTIEFIGICGMDSCICNIPFFIVPCNDCCKDKATFAALVESAISLTFDDKICKAKINISGLPQECNIEVVSVKWGDGSVSTGSYGNGDMIMHTYAPANVSYLIFIDVVEYDDNGKICNSYTLRKIVTPICEDCCNDKDYKKFKSLINQGFNLVVNDCEVTVTAPQFGKCFYFGSVPDFGDGPVPPTLVTNPSGTWTHTYNHNGTYNICVNVFAYDDGDTNNICWVKQMCTPVKVDACDSICRCNGFTNLSFHWDKTNNIPVKCNETATLICPPMDCAWSFTGELNCKGDCKSNNLDWKLVNQSTLILVASGTTMTYPNFGIYIPQHIVAIGGNYQLILTGHCDQNNCPCVINLILPGCTDPCPCDPQDLINDVNAGIDIITTLPNCTVCFQPKQLQDCDMVNWYLISNPNTPFATSLGNQTICHKFTNGGNHKIKMQVIRKKSGGQICDDFEKLITINVNCFGSPNKKDEISSCNIGTQLRAGILGDDGYSDLWSSISGEPKLINDPGKTNSWYLKLAGNLNRSDAIYTSSPICLESDDVELRLKYRIPFAENLKHGSKIKICLSSDPINKFINKNPFANMNLFNVANFKIPEHIGEWIEYSTSVNLSRWKNELKCLSFEGKQGYVIIYVENEIGNNLRNSLTELEITDICIDQSTIETSTNEDTKYQFTVFPNPTQSEFIFSQSSDQKLRTELFIYNQMGQLVDQFQLTSTQHNLNFGKNYISGFYILKTKMGNKTHYTKLIKQSH
ncbi:MAG: PKD domain-containing protein [Saprospiraceae bacterium]|nr:PKD domain-containing protein [Candidatus Defluviibacterium haderslevense]